MRIAGRKLAVWMLILALFLHPVAQTTLVYAQTEEPTPTQVQNQTPTPEATPTQQQESNQQPTPTPATDENALTIDAPTPTPAEFANSYDNTATPEAHVETYVSGDENSATTAVQTTVLEKIENTNDAVATIEAKTEAVTGQNTVLNSVSSTIDTGVATASEFVENILNTNIVGEGIIPAILSFFDNHTGEIDLASAITGCPDVALPLSESKTTDAVVTGDKNNIQNTTTTDVNKHISNENTAVITNDITVNAISGQNNITDGLHGQTQTGDAIATASVFNMANVNVVGDCGFFGIINLFGGQNGDIILPYELGFIQPTLLSQPFFMVRSLVQNSGDENTFTNTFNLARFLTVNNTNNANVDTTINAQANSGANQGSGLATVSTGDAGVYSNILDMINTNIVGDNFFFFRVNMFSKQTGSTLSSFTFFNPLVSWYSLNSESDVLNSGDQNTLSNTINLEDATQVDNTNTATVINNINVVADTGTNYANGEEMSVTTGDAQAKVNVFNFLNTNIVGRNFYFAVVNIFDDFVGNIVFPRADLVAGLSTNKPFPKEGEVVEVTASVTNIGRQSAGGTTAHIQLPDYLELIGSPAGASVAGNTLLWNAGTLPKNTGASFSFSALVKNTPYHDFPLNIHAKLATKTLEDIFTNNSSVITLKVNKQPTQSGGATGGSSSSGGGGSAQGSSSGNSGNSTSSGAGQVQGALYTPQYGYVTKTTCKKVKSCVVKKGKKICSTKNVCTKQLVKNQIKKAATKKAVKKISPKKVVNKIKKVTQKNTRKLLNFLESTIFGGKKVS